MARPFPDMGPEELHRLFKEGDANKDGLVDYGMACLKGSTDGLP